MPRPVVTVLALLMDAVLAPLMDAVPVHLVDAVLVLLVDAVPGRRAVTERVRRPVTVVRCRMRRGAVGRSSRVRAGVGISECCPIRSIDCLR
ncbi:hypothetical protein GOOTI_032_00070 [Gordonia otitidis NBRC 100426]|uniref:Uncharacterized protein n=1 Tax=Gordonia otitidis (strain DSM 44809 / CCUG 52243 / JCM 12355 / NBRC 100426 / IFM 10032) TaxID=1108044 RepID=H5THD2_GORO1|nr:hypothetical protein GOOTI_032_00070 [Gordonia otitidis NBRC 100426]